jgi:hypothetical protein
MNRSKKLYALLGVLAAGCAVTFAVSKYEEHKENIKNSDETILAVDSTAVESLSWQCESGSYAFTKGDTWQYDDDAEFPVSEEKIDELLGEFAEFGVSFIIEDVDDFSQYGLDDPVCTINIATADETYEIKLGDYSTMDEKRYLSIGDGNVYLASDDPVEEYDIELSDLIDNDDTPSYSQLQTLEFEGTDTSSAADGNMTAYTFTYSEDGGDSYREDDVYFTSANGQSLPLDTTKVDSYARMLSYLDLTDYVTYKATDDDIAAYGLDDPELTVTMTYTPSDDDSETSGADDELETFVIKVSRDPETIAAEEEAAASGDDTESTDENTENSEEASDDEDEIAAYVQVGDSPIIYQIAEDDFENLMAYTYNDLRHDEILPADVEDISKLDITLEGSEYSLTVKEVDGESVWYRGDSEVDADDLEDALDALTADSFTTETPSGKEEISIRIHVPSKDDADDDSEEQTETESATEEAEDSADTDTIQITFYRYDGNNCVAVIDGKPQALVARSLVVDLIEAVNAIVL